jgi:uncharacterized membrane protein
MQTRRKVLALGPPTAAIVSTVVGLPQAWGNVDLRVLGIAVVSAVLLPLVPWTLELYALRRLTKAAFGTLMSLEPAIALIVGIVVLQQLPDPKQYIGIACVVVAGIAAKRTGHRVSELPDLNADRLREAAREGSHPARSAAARGSGRRYKPSASPTGHSRTCNALSRRASVTKSGHVSPSTIRRTVDLATPVARWSSLTLTCSRRASRALLIVRA